MSSFKIGTEEITAFAFENTYLFTECFDKKQLFNQLKKYHNKYNYCFKVPEGGLKEVKQTLDNYFYELVIEDSPEGYCVVGNEETDTYAILRNSVMSKQPRNHDIYLMNDKLSHKQTIEQGEIRIESPKSTQRI